jgi:hypothetical protein
MQAQNSIDVEATGASVRGACLVSGCTCKDARIVSRRRAAFFAAMALRSGQTAQRVILCDPDWRIPLAALTDLVVSVVREDHALAEEPPAPTLAPTFARESESER